MKNRFLILAILVLCAAAVPIAASAYDEPCGDNVIWKLKDSVLTISGTGPMWDYDDESNPSPWSKYSVRQVKIEEGVTSVGKDAFAGIRYSMTVTLANSVTSIGNSAFYGCIGLNTISLGNGLTSIATVLFRIELGFNISGIHDSEFVQCESQFTKPFHDEGNGAAADFIPASNGTESDTILA